MLVEEVASLVYGLEQKSCSQSVVKSDLNGV